MSYFHNLFYFTFYLGDAYSRDTSDLSISLFVKPVRQSMTVSYLTRSHQFSSVSSLQQPDQCPSRVIALNVDFARKGSESWEGKKET